MLAVEELGGVENRGVEFGKIALGLHEDGGDFFYQGGRWIVVDEIAHQLGGDEVGGVLVGGEVIEGLLAGIISLGNFVS